MRLACWNAFRDEISSFLNAVFAHPLRCGADDLLMTAAQPLCTVVFVVGSISLLFGNENI